ncbi:MAG: rod shape-determining protein RodA [Elusimicrobia bacterium]|nr:rod shape-determining protein RodA [Elusimicrobiota bacterium]
MIQDHEEKTLLQKFADHIDWVMILALFYLIGTGLITIFSATLHSGHPEKFMVTQTAAIAIGVAGMIFLTGFNYQYFRQMLPYIYIISLVVMVTVLVGGSTVRGTKGWFHLGYFSFQPVEVVKLLYILVIAGFLDSRWRDTKKFSVFAAGLALLGGHVLLILMQPDFGSTLSYFPVTLVLMFVAGVEPLYIGGAIIMGGIAVGIPLLTTFFRLQPDLLILHPRLQYLVSAVGNLKHASIILGSITAFLFTACWFLRQLKINVSWLLPLLLTGIIVAGSYSSLVVEHSLKEYQRKRLIVFLNPEIDALGSGYNIIQSKIAIGSGKIFGKGLFSGTQSQLGFLPEQHTDFIFAVHGEEGGYLWAQMTIIFYFLLVWRAMLIARESRDRYGSLVATGLATMFAFYAVINIGMVMGLMPATGLPLPFLSYGGSSMVGSLWGIGLLLSIHIRRFTH